jgi:hypothetical protein
MTVSKFVHELHASSREYRQLHVARLYHHISYPGDDAPGFYGHFLEDGKAIYARYLVMGQREDGPAIKVSLNRNDLFTISLPVLNRLMEDLCTHACCYLIMYSMQMQTEYTVCYHGPRLCNFLTTVQEKFSRKTDDEIVFPITILDGDHVCESRGNGSYKHWLMR